jgi:hypothetical protein
LLLLLLILKPPFVIKPLAAPGSDSQAASSKGAQFAEKVWASKVLSVIEAKAQEIAKILPEIGRIRRRRDKVWPASRRILQLHSEGNREGAQVHTESQAGTMVSKFGPG